MRAIALRNRVASVGQRIELERLDVARFPKGREPELTKRGSAFDTAWSVYRDRDEAERILREAYLEQPSTAALMQGLHGKGAVPVDGALHLLTRHGLADVREPTWFRAFLQVLNDLDIIAYSKRNQTVRIVAPMPVLEEDEKPKPSVRVIERDRPYSNIRHLRETLRETRDFIWWADPYFEKRAFEPLVDEADATKIREIKILSGGQPKAADVEAFKRFKSEMGTLGIGVEWRMVDKPQVEWHDRYIVTKGKAWNVPPISAVFQGKHSQITEASAPPFADWWEKGMSVEEL